MCIRDSIKYDAIVIGAGMSGLYQLYKLRSLGFKVLVIEAGSGVGGTWYWNRYPGARCDVPSIEYSFSFSSELQQEWQWTEVMAAQPEILDYANHIAERFDLRSDIEFSTRVTSAHFRDDEQRWHVTTDSGKEYAARFCVMATGCLSVPNTPQINGADSFAGDVFHTGNWPAEGVDFSARRVGIIGTGSSAIQSIPVIAEQAEHRVQARLLRDGEGAALERRARLRAGRVPGAPRLAQEDQGRAHGPAQAPARPEGEGARAGVLEDDAALAPDGVAACLLYTSPSPRD